MGVAANGPHPLSDIAPRAPLLKILEITPGVHPLFAFSNSAFFLLNQVTEEAYLKQLAIEEWYGKKQAEKAKAEKEEL